MQAVQNAPPDGFFRIIIVSLALHAVIIIGLFFYKGEERKFLQPVYNVSLVSPAELTGAQTSATKAVAGAVVQRKPAPQKASARQNDAPFKKAAPLKIKRGATPVKIHDPLVSKTKRPKEAHSVDASIERITKKVKETDDAKELASHIEALKKKSSAGNGTSAGGGGGAGGASKTTGGAKTTGLQNYQAQAGAASQKTGAGTTENFTVKNAAYLNLIRERVAENWIFPAQFNKERFSVIITIKIGKNGRLLESWVEKSSGSGMFDDSLMDAIKKSAPFPPLPQDVEGDFLETGFRFCKNCN